MLRLFIQSMILYCSFCMHTPAICTPQQCSALAHIEKSVVSSVVFLMHCRKSSAERTHLEKNRHAGQADIVCMQNRVSVWRRRNH